MKDLEVRSGFEPYGATAYFGADQRLIKIVHSHEGMGGGYCAGMGVPVLKRTASERRSF